MLISETGICSRLQVVFVHAENDTTMPWAETEALFTSTLKAVVEVTLLPEGPPENLKVVDLGEAGRQEVWQAGSKYIQKTIAKHGGKRARAPDPDRVPALVPEFLCCTGTTGSHQTNLLCPLRASIYGFCEAVPVSCLVNVSPARGHAAGDCHYPCLIHAVIDPMPRLPASLGNFKANVCQATTE
jgi:hypothetical protein